MEFGALLFELFQGLAGKAADHAVILKRSYREKRIAGEQVS